MAFFLYKFNGAIFIFIIIQSNIYITVLSYYRISPKPILFRTFNLPYLCSRMSQNIKLWLKILRRERVLTEYSKIQWVLFMYKKSLNTLTEGIQILIQHVEQKDAIAPSGGFPLSQATFQENTCITKYRMSAYTIFFCPHCQKSQPC